MAEKEKVTWVSSDWHCDQNKLKETVEKWIKQGKEEGHRLIGGGDLFDILPLGRKVWNSAASIKQLAAALDGYSFDYVAGNHDPYGDMKGLMAPYPNISMHKRMVFESGGRTFFVTHGHRWSIDWGFLRLRNIAPPVVEFLANSPLRSLWYRFCRSRGWLARHPHPNPRPGKEHEQINNLTRIIWAGASDHAIKKNCCVVIGHTHTTGRRERGVSKKNPSQTYMIDDGNLPDGTYVKITGKDAELAFL